MLAEQTHLISALPWPDDAPPIKARHVTMIAKSGKELVWATNVGEKRDLLRFTRGPVWAVWTGQWSSHLFVIDRKQAVTELT